MCREIVQISSMEDKYSNFTQNEQVVLKAFDKFIEVFIIGKKSLIIEYDYDFTKDDISNCLKFLNDHFPYKVQNKKNGKEEETYGTIDDLKNALDEIEDSVKKKKYQILLCHCYWIMYLMNDKSKTFVGKTGLKVREKYLEDECEIPLFVDKEIASTNMAYSSRINKAFIDIVTLFHTLFESYPPEKVEYEIKDIKAQILDALLDNRAKNVLLYLCDPKLFPCIISQRHQDAIYESLSKLYEKKDVTAEPDAVQKVVAKFSKEAHVKNIENGVFTDFGCTNLYDDKIKPFWDKSSTNLSTDKSDELPNDTLLKYKKAIVLYGPPGTSKSYEARTMSRDLIEQEFAKNFIEELTNGNNVGKNVYKTKLKQFIDYFIDICDEKRDDDEKTNTSKKTYSGIPHIHRLQLHPGYTYDDFIVGKTINESKVVVQKGYLMRLIDEIRWDRSANTQYANLPHILILDEINRVDISRVFGELFTAMEKDYRKTGVDLPVTEGRNGKSWKLQVPEDLYIIGTMNMIDFSLEQVDFALRRRFAWIESNYEEKRLKAIIEEKRLKAKADATAASSITDKEIKEFTPKCSALNAKISNETSLGPAYQIGHAFFAEIVDIYSQVKSDNKQNPWDVAQNVLWSISIRPTLDAYCGSMDNEQKKQFIGDCKEVFIPKKSTDVSTNKQGAAQSSSGNE